LQGRKVDGVMGASMSKFGFAVAMPFGAALMLGGCGTYVPDTQDFPGNTGDQQLLVQAIVQSVHCEVENAISDFYRQARQYPAMQPMARALDSWGLQMTLSLKTEEKGTLSPTVAWSPPSPAAALFTLGSSATLSSDATRTDKLYFYYKVKELKNRHCPTGVQPAAPVSSPLIQNNLKFGDWLYDVLIPAGTNEITLPTSPSGPLKQNVIYYEVSFEVATTGSLTPSWKFTHVSVNPTGTLAAATRDRTHDLQITMGPGDDTGLKGPAQTAQLSGDVGLSVANGIRRLVGP
jgi:hypothetical protein